MRKLLDRRIASVGERLVLLTPARAPVRAAFTNVDMDPRRHRELLREVQQFRGSVYLQDGAVGRHDLSDDGLHERPDDEDAWHFVLLDADQRVTACMAYVERENTTLARLLRLHESELMRHHEWRPTVMKAVESELALARQDGIGYAEVGGWAVHERVRCSPDGLVLALAAFSFGQICGGALALTTATVRHDSSSILRRLGGQHLEADGRTLPPYYDSKYGCEMELLRFDSRRSNPKYRGLIDMLHDKLAHVLVIGPAPGYAESREGLLLPAGVPLTRPELLSQPAPLVAVM